MARAITLKVQDREVLSTKITYDDLIILYKQYIDEYGEVPTYSKCDSKHNLPQGRIITHVLNENNITYNDFLLQFGKTSHVRTESKDYSIYLHRYKEICEKLGRPLVGKELFCNEYGLPNAMWFVKNCPDDTVHTYNDFVLWCGYESNKLKKDDETVGKKLIELEKQLGRPIIKSDITIENVGFSNIVVNRLYGGLNNAKKELGLLETPTSHPLPFSYYHKKLDNILTNFSKYSDRKCITWADIESEKYSDSHLNHKTVINAFSNEKIDIFAYIKSKGFTMNPSNFSYHHTFDDGERVVSTMEYDFSKYLRSIGLSYNKDYYRDVMYKKFSDETSKMNCDYMIMIDDVPLYIEIAGIIYNCTNESWHTHVFASKRENDYRDKLLRKEQRLLENNCNYLFLFKADMCSDDYKTILQNKIKETKGKVA